MIEQGYNIRTMKRDEIGLAIDWAAEEGWNPGLYDADSFLAADPGGFLIGELDGEPIATISVVKYGETFGFLGFYIVKPDHRSKGYGLHIWNEGMARLEGRNVGLDGVVDQQDNYRKSGFRLAYRNVRFEGVTQEMRHDDPSVVELSRFPFEMVAQYDRLFFPEKRTTFLRSWLNQPESVALGTQKEGKISGYGMIRRCRSGYKIGPLFADDRYLADNLFRALVSKVKSGEPVFLDVPEVNREAVRLAENYGMHVMFETARMYTGKFPDLPMNRLFGVTTFELG